MIMVIFATFIIIIIIIILTSFINYIWICDVIEHTCRLSRANWAHIGRWLVDVVALYETAVVLWEILHFFTNLFDAN